MAYIGLLRAFYINYARNRSNHVRWNHRQDRPHCALRNSVRKGKTMLENIPQVVKEAIENAFPTSSEAIFAELKYSSLNNYYYFTLYGTHVGVEPDGYIHS